ncbi:MAG: hypothetical protein DLM62_17225 [Pseudonocardiales bacterium]|nr:MAG: hypothetical protein DLM62_17225 [Pseudonocardiales bacterium]
MASREPGRRGITVNTVSPGATDTDLLRTGEPPEALEVVAQMTALGRVLRSLTERGAARTRRRLVIASGTGDEVSGPVEPQTGTTAAGILRASTSIRRSLPSLVRIWSPGSANSATSASTASDIPPAARSSPAAFASASRVSRISIIDRWRASRACREPFRHACATTGAAVTSDAPARRPNSMRPATRRSSRAIPISAPASSTRFMPPGRLRGPARGTERRPLRQAFATRPRRTARARPGAQRARRQPAVHAAIRPVPPRRPRRTGRPAARRQPGRRGASRRAGRP